MSWSSEHKKASKGEIRVNVYDEEGYSAYRKVSALLFPSILNHTQTNSDLIIHVELLKTLENSSKLLLSTKCFFVQLEMEQHRTIIEKVPYNLSFIHWNFVRSLQQDAIHLLILVNPVFVAHHRKYSTSKSILQAQRSGDKESSVKSLATVTLNHKVCAINNIF